MTYKQISLIALAAIMSVRCEDFKSPESGHDEITTQSVEKTGVPEPEVTTSKELKDTLAAQVEPTAKPERYMVYFSWASLEPGKKIRIRQAQTLATVSSEQTTFSHEVDHNQNLTYTFDLLDSNSRIEQSISKLVTIPTDYVIRSGQAELAQDQKINVKRVFLNSETPLRTNGGLVEINTEELISTRGTIETFPEGSKAGLNTDGRSGGSLTIRSKIATGELRIIMRGEAGGDGAVGSSYAGRASNGSAPGPGVQECSCGRNCNVRAGCRCTSRGDNGTNGVNGAKGLSGNNGGRGGDTGTLKIEIEDGSAFHLETEKQIGLGGNPGPGGPGQLGGLAINISNPSSCSGQPGSNGFTGSPGDPGLPGPNGIAQLTCINITSESKNDCY